jgi:hypothetical protein
LPPKCNTKNRVSKGTIVLYIEIEEEASVNMEKEVLIERTMWNNHPEGAGAVSWTLA